MSNDWNSKLFDCCSAGNRGKSCLVCCCGPFVFAANAKRVGYMKFMTAFFVMGFLVISLTSGSGNTGTSQASVSLCYSDQSKCLLHNGVMDPACCGPATGGKSSKCDGSEHRAVFVNGTSCGHGISVQEVCKTEACVPFVCITTASKSEIEDCENIDNIENIIWGVLGLIFFIVYMYLRIGVREAIRAKYDIRGSCCMDCLVVYFCGCPCSGVQETNQIIGVDKIGEDMLDFGVVLPLVAGGVSNKVAPS